MAISWNAYNVDYKNKFTQESDTHVTSIRQMNYHKIRSAKKWFYHTSHREYIIQTPKVSAEELQLILCDWCDGIIFSLILCDWCDGIIFSLILCDWCDGIIFSLILYDWCDGIIFCLFSVTGVIELFFRLFSVTGVMELFFADLFHFPVNQECLPLSKWSLAFKEDRIPWNKECLEGRGKSYKCIKILRKEEYYRDCIM